MTLRVNSNLAHNLIKNSSVKKQTNYVCQRTKKADLLKHLAAPPELDAVPQLSTLSIFSAILIISQRCQEDVRSIFNLCQFFLMTYRLKNGIKHYGGLSPGFMGRKCSEYFGIVFLTLTHQMERFPKQLYLFHVSVWEKINIKIICTEEEH